MYEQEGEHFYPSSPHNDIGLWELQIFDAFGTRSRSVVMTFLEHLRRLVPAVRVEGVADWKPDETELNAALAMIADIKPRNVVEAALAAQMVAVHWLQMRLSAQASNRFCITLERQDVALAGKLARTFTMQLDALAKLRGKQKISRQTIRVRKELHQHVHYHNHRGMWKLTDNPMNLEPPQLRSAPRCQARNRLGKPCNAPAVAGRRMCRMHGGRSTGAPKGDRNGNWKHGGYTSEAVAVRQSASRLLKALLQHR